MEEDIKILEEVIEKYKTNTANILDLDSNDLFKRLILNQEQVQLLENLIKGYKLEKLKNVLDEQSLKEALEDYIPKSKIKEKIEELDKKEKEELKGLKGQDRYFVKQMYMYKRNILQELMEDK